MNLRTRTKNHAPNPEIRFLTKLVSNQYATQWPFRQRGSKLLRIIRTNLVFLRICRIKVRKT